MSEINKPKLFDSLTGLRGISAIMVIIAHCISSDLELKTFVGSKAFSISGDMAVLFFFVLSGFLLTYKAYCEILPPVKVQKKPVEIVEVKIGAMTPIEELLNQNQTVSQEGEIKTNETLKDKVPSKLDDEDGDKIMFLDLKAKVVETSALVVYESRVVIPTKMSFIFYFLRRMFRIYPAYIAVLLFSEDTVYPNPLTIRFWKRFFLLPTSYAHLWTIRVELAYYMMVPLLQYICAWALKFEEKRRNENKRHIPLHMILLSVLTGIAIGISFSGRVYIPTNPENRPAIYQYFPIFWYGSLAGTVYFYLKEKKFTITNFTQKRQKMALWATEILTYSIMVCIIFTNKYSSITFLGKETWLCQVQAPVVSPLYGLLILLLVLSNESSSFGRFFCCNFFLWTGKASYSIYLIQYAAINLVLRTMNIQGIEANFVVIVLNCAFGWALHRFVEEPGVKVGNSLIKHIKSRKEEAKKENTKSKVSVEVH